MYKEPLKLRPVPKEILWGGTRLKSRYNKSAEFERIAESWELCSLTGSSAAIDGGSFDRVSFSEYVTRYPEAIGFDWDGGDFPLLIKFIDAEKDLSIQVHPGEIYAATHAGIASKNEAWYIVEADEGAEIVYGFKKRLTEAEMKSALVSGGVSEYLERVSVKAGDTFLIPAGQVHAICKGILIAEVQQSSDTTFRIYDYDRVDATGKKRGLHINEALEVVRYYTDEEISRLNGFRRSSRREPLCEGEILSDCPYFRLAKIRCTDELTFTVDEKSFACLLFTSADNARVSCGTKSIEAITGDCVFIPAGAGKVTLSGSAEILLCDL